MKAIINDKDVFLSVRPLNLVGYLRARGWEKYSERVQQNSVWINRLHPDAEIVIPFNRHAADFVIQIKNALNELEYVEGRSQLDIIRDLLNSGFDVVRIAARSSSTNDGTIRIDDGVRLFSEARDILMAAACSAVRPRSVFHARKPLQANEFMEHARLGQTEHGSYVLTMLSPVAPQLTAHSDTNLFPEEPFERKVIRTLSSGIQHAVGAAMASSLRTASTFEPFQLAVEHGVSANLCEAIVGFFDIHNPAEIAFSINWAQNRLQPDNVVSRILVSEDVIPTIAEAAKIFRQTDVLENYQISGPVVKLERQDNSLIGQVTLLARVEDAVRKVVLNLSLDDYEKATIAHSNFLAVKVSGTVRKDGRSYRLTDPTGFDFANEDDD